MMIKHKYFWILLLCIGFNSILNPVPLRSQTYKTFQSESERIRENARWKLGSFRIFPSIQLRNIGYNNNIYQMSEDDNPIGDYTATISFPFSFYLPYRDLIIISLDISPGYDFYLNEANQSGINYRISPGVRFLLFNRFVLSGSYRKQKRRERPNIEFDTRIYVESMDYGASLFYETARGTALGFSGRVNRIAYEDIEGEISYSSALNREERSGKFEFYYSVFKESQFFLTAEYIEYNFDDLEYQWRNSYSYALRSGIRFPLLGTARGTLSFGYRWLINRSETYKLFSGPIGDTGLDFRLGRFNMRFQYARDFQFSYTSTYSYFLVNRFGFGISFYLTPVVRLDYDFSYGSGVYPEGQSNQQPEGELEEIERKDSYLSSSAGIAYRIVRNTGIGLTLTYWKRESDIEEFGRAGMFIGAYLTYDF